MHRKSLHQGPIQQAIHKTMNLGQLNARMLVNSYKNEQMLLRSAMAGRLYKHHAKHTSNSGFDQTFMPCSGYTLFAAEQRVGYQISWVDLQREVNCP